MNEPVNINIYETKNYLLPKSYYWSYKRADLTTTLINLTLIEINIYV